LKDITVGKRQGLFVLIAFLAHIIPVFESVYF